MKILIIMSGFFPGKKYGGPPVSVDNFCTLMTGVNDCYIVAHNHDMGEKTPYATVVDGWNNRGNAKVMYLSDDKYCYSTFLNIAHEICPDYIYLQGLFQGCIIPSLIIAKTQKIKVVLAPRGELCSGAFDKKYKKLPYIWFLKLFKLIERVRFQSTSEEETEAIVKLLAAKKEDIYLLPNIPSIPRSLPERMTKQSGIGRFVFISRIVEKKNLLSAIHYFQNIHGNALFDIYGPLEDKQYWKECESAISQLSDNVKVRYQGIINHDEIHGIFAAYDAFLFPTYSENYGHVIAEALLSGCVPVISDQTPWSDINESQAGWALPLHSPQEFSDAVQKIVDMNDKDIALVRNNISIYTAKKMKLEDLKKDYLRMFK